MTKTQQLEALRNYSTRYEIAVKKNGLEFLLAYSPQRSRRGIETAIRNRAEAFIKVTGATEFNFGKKAQDGATANGWTVNWTGRTQREAIIEGERTYIGDALTNPDLI